MYPRADAADRFARHVIELLPGASLEPGDIPWQDAIVFVTVGQLDVDTSDGEHHRFRAGDVLTLARLPIHEARNRGATQTRLLAIWRRP